MKILNNFKRIFAAVVMSCAMLAAVPATAFAADSVTLVNDLSSKYVKVTLSPSAYTYNGKERHPSVTVKDMSDNIIASSNYTVTYTKNKNVGAAQIAITFNGKSYSGTINKTFIIQPKGTNFSKWKGGKNSVTLSWKKQMIQTSGYQIRYSTYKNMKNSKTVSINKNTTTSYTIKNLTAKKKYYVQIRTFKKIGNSYYYSGWSI